MTGRCQTCDAVLSDDYVRVFGDNDGRVDTCRFCPRASEATPERKRTWDSMHVGGEGDGIGDGFDDVLGGRS